MVLKQKASHSWYCLINYVRSECSGPLYYLCASLHISVNLPVMILRILIWCLLNWCLSSSFGCLSLIFLIYLSINFTYLYLKKNISEKDSFFHVMYMWIWNQLQTKLTALFFLWKKVWVEVFSPNPSGIWMKRSLLFEYSDYICLVLRLLTWYNQKKFCKCILNSSSFNSW